MKQGCLFSPVDLRDFRVCSTLNKIELPTEFTLGATRIKDQGTVNSCVAHSLSEILENKLGYNYSTGWIYGYRPNDYYQGEGMYPREALATLLNIGAVLNDDFDYNVEMPMAKDLVDCNIDKLEAQADDLKISSYARLYTTDEIKSWLFTNKVPVLIAIATNEVELDENNIIQIPSSYPNCGHAMVIVGWNELGFIIQNSWGETWGDKGLATLPYEYEIRESWGVTLNDILSGDKVRKPTCNLIRKVLMFLYKIITRVIERWL